MTMTQRRGVKRGDDHNNERSADRQMHDIFLGNALQRERERQRRHDRQSTAQSEQAGHQAGGNASEQINPDEFHRHNRRASLAQDSARAKFFSDPVVDAAPVGMGTTEKAALHLGLLFENE